MTGYETITFTLPRMRERGIDLVVGRSISVISRSQFEGATFTGEWYAARRKVGNVHCRKI